MAKPSKATLRRRAKRQPRYTSGPKKGKFKPKAKTTRRRRKKTAATSTRRRKKTTTKRRSTKRRTVKRTASKRVSPKRRAAGKKAARTRAANKRKRVAAGKKAAKTRKRRGNPGVKAKTNPRRRRRRKTATRRNPVARRRKRRVSMATRKKISRALKRRNRSNPPKRKRRKSRAKGRLSKQRVRLRAKPRAKRKSTYRVRRTRRVSRGGHSYYQYNLSRQNPGGALKGAFMAGLGVYSGVLAARVLGNVLQKKVFTKDGVARGGMPSFLTSGLTSKILPGAAMLALSVFLLPKVLKGKPNIIRGLQMGSVVALADGLVQGLIAQGTIPSSVSSYLSGYSGFGGFAYTQPLAEYVDYDNRLGEYVDYDNRLGSYGGEATEPLALGADELAYFQTGGAGGVFNKTVFSGVG